MLDEVKKNMLTMCKPIANPRRKDGKKEKRRGGEKRKEGKKTIFKNRQTKSLELKAPLCEIKTYWMILTVK